MLYDFTLQHPVFALVIFVTVCFVIACEYHREIPIIFLCIFLLIAVLVADEDKAEKELKDTKYQVDWDYVNVRDDANGNKIGRLEYGQTVTLTGERIVIDGIAKPYDFWVEIYPGGKWVSKYALVPIE